VAGERARKASAVYQNQSVTGRDVMSFMVYPFHTHVIADKKEEKDQQAADIMDGASPGRYGQQRCETGQHAIPR
jgi:hypothetical protein